MKSHFELSDLAFEQSFSKCLLDPALFTHEAHLRLAWIHIHRYGIYKAVENISSQLLAYVCHVGAVDKYNKTVTIAAVRAVSHFMLRSDTRNFSDFILENPRLKNSLKALLATHYRTDIFNSARAQKEYLEPELLPFD